MFYNGVEFDVDKKEAARIFRMAADVGHAKSMHKYGFMRLTGDGIQKDETESVLYLQMSSEKGNLDSQSVLKSLE